MINTVAFELTTFIVKFIGTLFPYKTSSPRITPGSTVHTFMVSTNLGKTLKYVFILVEGLPSVDFVSSITTSLES